MSKVRLSVEMTGVESGQCREGWRRTAPSEKPWRLKMHGRHIFPPRELCTDNAVMIAAAGYDAYVRGAV